MGLLDLFRKKEQPQETANADKNAVHLAREENIVENKEMDLFSASAAEFGAKLPIDIIYNFLKEDYENKAYRDALTNPDKSYKETNLVIIRSNLEIKFKQAALRYEDMLQDIDFHIQSRTQAGLSDIVELLKSKKETYIKHLAEISKMKKDLENDELYMTGIFKSYEVGFTRGLASLSLHNLRIDSTL